MNTALDSHDAAGRVEACTQHLIQLLAQLAARELLAEHLTTGQTPDDAANDR